MITVPMSWYEAQENETKFAVMSCRECQPTDDTVTLCRDHAHLLTLVSER